MQDARVRWALAGVCLIAFITSGLALWSKQRPAPPPIVITQAPPVRQDAPPAALSSPPRPGTAAMAPPAAPRRPAPHLLYVHVAGAVRRPSLYALPSGSRVMQAVQAAGGPTPRADLDAVNLAEKVTDGEKVYVPRRGQGPAVPPGNSLGYAPAPLSPTALAARESAGGRAGKLRSPAEGRVNLNTADAAELQRLPGVGPAMAARILAYRAQAGRFERPDDLMQVGHPLSGAKNVVPVPGTDGAPVTEVSGPLSEAENALPPMTISLSPAAAERFVAFAEATPFGIGTGADGAGVHRDSGSAGHLPAPPA